MNGTVGILNVGVGDTKLSFDPKNPAERIRAARIVRDMLRRGYALLVEVEQDGRKVFTRAHDFDENTCEYIIADFDPTQGEAGPGDARGQQSQAQENPSQADPAADRPKRGRPRKVKLKAESVRSVAVAPTAGG